MASIFSPLKAELEKYLSKKQIDSIRQVYQFAKKAHHFQIRSSGEIYISHPIMVATILANMRMDAPSIIAAILHDVLEDTPIKRPVLQKRFGEEVLQLVDGVTKLERIDFSSRAEAQAENFRKMILAMTRDLRVILIRLADRLHNMRTLEYLDPERRHRIAKETLTIYAPIANRLGINWLRVELEDLAFTQLYPVRSQVLRTSITKARGNRKEVISLIRNALNGALKNSKLPHFRLEGREKYIYSLYRKMKMKHLRLSEVMDVYGFRIIVHTVDDCYRALGVVHSLYKPVPEKFKDYIAIPKANGYQSLHTVLFGPYGLPVEIQIRTEEMDKMAENGIAAHWLYKTNAHIEDIAQKRAKEWIKGLLEIQQTAGSSLEFIENVRFDLFPDEVYVFTHKGDILELPNGSTPVDFAYSVHSAIGNKCLAAKIDRRLVPLSTKLSSGQTIEIITAKEAHPNPNWLNFVVTGKARSKIRHYLKQQKRSDTIVLGHSLLSKALNNLNLSMERIEPKQLKKVLQISHFNTFDDLLEAIGLGDQIAPVVAQRFLSESTHPVETESGQKQLAQEPLQIRGAENLVVTFAKCCMPIPGDLIEGVFTAGHGIVIHRSSCKNLKEFRRQPDKCIPVRWADDVKGEFEVCLRLDIVNERGVLAKIAADMTDQEANIDSAHIIEKDGRCSSMRLTISVKNRKHLAQILCHLKALKNVIKVAREYNC